MFSSIFSGVFSGVNDIYRHLFNRSNWGATISKLSTQNKLFAAIILGTFAVVASSYLVLNQLRQRISKPNFPSPIPLPEWILQESHAAFPNISTDLRYSVRDNTKNAIENRVGIKMQPNDSQQNIEQMVKDFEEKLERIEIPTVWRDDLPFEELIKYYLSKIKIFTPEDAESYQSQEKKELLGRFDVLAVPCTMDYDANWQPWTPDHNEDKQPNKPFWLHHGAALNIGEKKATDFKDYFVKGEGKELNEDKYIEDMAEIFYSMLEAQRKTGVNHVVWFPFGMGAFLQHLPTKDAKYKKHEALTQLRNRIAQAFVDILKNEQFSKLKVHMCLPLDDKPGSVTQQNYNAFVKAFLDPSNSESIKDNVKVYVNRDATDLAQSLANEHGAFKVSLANGANRLLIGNHWYADGAHTAIDENVHRRTESASLLALLLNGGIDPKERMPTELMNCVRRLSDSDDAIQFI